MGSHLFAITWCLAPRRHLIGPFLTLFLDESKEKLILLDEVYSFSEKSSPEMVAERKLII